MIFQNLYLVYNDYLAASGTDSFLASALVWLVRFLLLLKKAGILHIINAGIMYAMYRLLNNMVNRLSLDKLNNAFKELY